MAEMASVAKAKKELEELYRGVADDSVNLTFQDFVQVKTQNQQLSTDLKSKTDKPISNLEKLPSLDFNRALEPSLGGGDGGGGHDYDMSPNASMSAATSPTSFQGRRRPGIPHSIICAVCASCIYIFRHRCLVCGRVYCRQCVGMGMGEMSEGRKCVDCLGKRFSQRYIQRAGQIGCCMGYPSIVKQQELIWAEKGPRRNSRPSTISRSRSPAQRTPPTAHSPSFTPSFVMDSPYSPYTPTRHLPLPL